MEGGSPPGDGGSGYRGDRKQGNETIATQDISKYKRPGLDDS